MDFWASSRTIHAGNVVLLSASVTFLPVFLQKLDISVCVNPSVLPACGRGTLKIAAWDTALPHLPEKTIPLYFPHRSR